MEPLIKFFFPLSLLFFSFIPTESFNTIQKKYSRVKEAYAEKEKTLKNLYKEKNIDFTSQQVYIRIFKSENELEVWARSKEADKFSHIKTYPICSSSGALGPKRKQGDGQTPEGFYYIDRFNPQSSFHLSLGINYPNASDKILSTSNPGGDIFIHGNCVTIGCVPITVELIKEVYIIAVEAKSRGQAKVPVHIFPFKMNEENYKLFKSKNSTNIALIHFWENIKSGFDYFEKNKTIPNIRVNEKGKYLFN